MNVIKMLIDNLVRTGLDLSSALCSKIHKRGTHLPLFVREKRIAEADWYFVSGTDLNPLVIDIRKSTLFNFVWEV